MTAPILNYSIAYNAFQTIQFSNKLLSFVKRNGRVLAWMRPFDGLYFVKTYDSIYDIQANFNEFLEGDVTFFVNPVYPDITTGSASPEIWNWLRMNTPQEVIGLQSTP